MGTSPVYLQFSRCPFYLHRPFQSFIFATSLVLCAPLEPRPVDHATRVFGGWDPGD